MTIVARAQKIIPKHSHCLAVKLLGFLSLQDLSPDLDVDNLATFHQLLPALPPLHSSSECSLIILFYVLLRLFIALFWDL